MEDQSCFYVKGAEWDAYGAVLPTSFTSEHTESNSLYRALGRRFQTIDKLAAPGLVAPDGCPKR